ncbi:MAG: NUDIX hydrolase [Candidatus Paceibacterota bacterium]|jgi:hypothetical protein
MPKERKDWFDFARTPVGADYTVSVQVELWDIEHTHVCFVLDQGGTKTRRGITHEKPRGWGNPGGAVSEGETPLEGAIREVEQETNHMRKTFRINPIPVEVIPIHGAKAKEGKERYKVVFVGRIIDPHELLMSGPVKDPAGGSAGGVISRLWIAFHDLPGMEEVMSPGFLLHGEPIYRSHLGNIYSHQGEEI